MNDLSGEVRRLCIALDVHDHGFWHDPGQREIRRRLTEVIADASRQAGLDRLYFAEGGAPLVPGTVMLRGEQGDGVVLLLPSGVHEARVIAGFAGELRIALRQRNRHLGKNAPLRLRLRVAFHQGPTRVGDGGFTGRAVNMVRSLRDSDELRGALDEHPDADLAVAVSAPLFEDVIEHEHRDLRRHLFRQVTVRSKDVVTEAWISVPDAASGGRDIPRRVRVTPARMGAGLTGPIVNIDEY
ncbi:hypothetical protein AB0O34_12900 [Sphaerisporangium sp. NPDC088356]|uniref:hypothetical protein n=1 Tax=Sphaerisporangium sp. NPDC088356 TaxID=3154871 RepID=UPI00343EDBFD